MSRRRGRSKAPAKREVEEAEPIAIDARFVATRALFARARERVTPADVALYAPNDPGYPEYVAAFDDILRRGEAALRREFAVSETIALTRWRHGARPDPQRFRWFRVLTSAVEILLDDSDTPHYALAALLVDAFALAEAGDAAAPLDLLSVVAREVDAHPLRFAGADERAFCPLVELLLAEVDRLDPAAIEALCAALTSRFERWWELRGAAWADEWHPEKSLWQLTHFNQLHPVWLDLIAARFPTEPPAAAALKQRLLADGARWMQGERVVS